MDKEIEYISTLTEKEKIAMELAKNVLGTSFALKRCIGFVEYSKNKQDIDEKTMQHGHQQPASLSSVLS
tara:strand:+ start:32116 stop:32322 length:207 start_codon:yes stop_codon:yes gene_type:complete